MVVQFTIQTENSRHTFIMQPRSGKCFDNNKEITRERYDEALNYFNANRSKK